MFGTNSILVKTVAVAVVCSGIATAAVAQYQTYRAEKWEYSLGLKYALASDISGEGGSKAEVDEDLGFGFGAGYNFNDYFKVGGSFNWDSRGYRATGIGDDGSDILYNNSMDTTAIALNGTYFVLPGPLTPFVSGSMGYTFVDSNIQTGPPTTQCYYDPWWGYNCDTYTPTKSESGMSYALGIGLRFDLNESASFQLSYNKAWLDISNMYKTPDFDSIRIDFIARTF